MLMVLERSAGLRAPRPAVSSASLMQLAAQSQQKHAFFAYFYFSREAGLET
jgi:hypothetical protein